jgi:hypothetical protein
MPTSCEEGCEVFGNDEEFVAFVLVFVMLGVSALVVPEMQRMKRVPRVARMYDRLGKEGADLMYRLIGWVLIGVAMSAVVVRLA